jgi:hypothetical protein
MRTNRKLSLVAIFTNLLLAIVTAFLIQPITGFNPIVTATVIFAGGTGLQFIFPDMLKGLALAGVYREIWTGELVESFQPEIEASFLREIPDYSEYVQSSSGGENQVIHLVDIGADPEVLINNTTYPIGYETLEDDDIAFQLDKYTTKATKVTDDELYAITYDKIGTANKKHKNAILKKKFGKSVHAIAPTSHTVATPVIGTTGPVVAGKHSCCVDDVIELAAAFNAAGIPDDGNRILVFHTTHVSGILKEVKNFYKDYANTEKGMQLKALFYGFRVYVYHNNPFYVAATGVKASYGAVFNPATHNVASVAFYAPDMFRAEGATKFYYDEPDTQNQAAAINYRHYFLVAPKKARSIGALVTSNEVIEDIG